MISVSENFLVESECFFLQNKICPFLAQGICIYVGHSFLWNTVGPTPASHCCCWKWWQETSLKLPKCMCYWPVAHFYDVFVVIGENTRKISKPSCFYLEDLKNRGGGRIMVCNATFNNISVISWWSVLLVEETRVSRENRRPVESHWQSLSHNVVSSTPRLRGIGTQNVSGDRHWRHIGSCKSNYYTITATMLHKSITWYVL